MSLIDEEKVLAAWWPRDATNAERPGTGTGEGYVPTLQANDTVLWRLPTLTGGHWEPVANGDPVSPEIVFSDGDVLMTFVED